MDFLASAQQMKNELVANRRRIHRQPEVGLELPTTTRLVMEELAKMGYEPQEICSSGVSASVGGKKPGKVFLLRADMDALPMREDSGLSFASSNAYAHTCGHDMHAAMLLGAAKLLKNCENDLNGTVKLMFQPGEETFAGARSMIDAGILEAPAVDAAMGMHVMFDGELGTVGYGYGAISSSCDGFKITIHGKGAHGAMPEMGIDPINVGAHLHIALQELIARETPAQETAILTIGEFSAGHTHNIIPQTAVLKGTLRAYNKTVRAHLAERIREVADLVARTFRATAEYEVLAAVPSIESNVSLTDQIVRYVKELNLPLVGDVRLTPSEDFAYVTEKVPSTYLTISSKLAGSNVQHHHPKVLFNEDVLPLGAAILAQCAYRWLKENQ